MKIIEDWQDSLEMLGSLTIPAGSSWWSRYRQVVVAAVVVVAAGEMEKKIE